MMMRPRRRPEGSRRGGSRASVFEAIDKPALQPLPLDRFEISEWARARLNIDYRVAFDGNFYSVNDVFATSLTISHVFSEIVFLDHTTRAKRARLIKQELCVFRNCSASACS